MWLSLCFMFLYPIYHSLLNPHNNNRINKYNHFFSNFSLPVASKTTVLIICVFRPILLRIMLRFDLISSSFGDYGYLLFNSAYVSFRACMSCRFFFNVDNVWFSLLVTFVDFKYLIFLIISYNHLIKLKKLWVIYTKAPNMMAKIIKKLIKPT